MLEQCKGGGVVCAERQNPAAGGGPEVAGRPEYEPQVDDASKEFEDVDVDPGGMNLCVEFDMVEHFHRPIDRGRQSAVCRG